MGDATVEFEENTFYDQLENPDKFDVTVIDNPSAAKCHLKGNYEFHINSENFAIIDKVKNKRLYTWPFRYVRRYGKSSTNFQFEAGRKCQSGEGMFSIQTKEGDSEKIFDLVQTRFDLIKQRDREFKGDPPTPIDNKSTRSSRRELPPRQYENNPVPPVHPKVESPPHRLKSVKTPHKSTKPAKSAASLKKSEASSKPTKTEKVSSSSAAKASQINTFISQNKDAILSVADDDENTYSVMGRDEPSDEPSDGAAYSSVYTRKPAPAFNSNDDTYDEVRM